MWIRGQISKYNLELTLQSSGGLRGHHSFLTGSEANQNLNASKRLSNVVEKNLAGDA